MTPDPSRRRRLLARLGAVAGIGAVAGCTGDDDGESGDETATGSDSDGGETDGTGPGSTDNGTGGTDGTDGDADEIENPEQRIVELRAILREFPGGYEQSVLDRADRVRRDRRDSVVFVDLEPEPVSYRLATGWFVAPNTILTTRRKLGPLETVSIYTVEGDVYQARITWRHPGVENLALLEVPIEGTPVPRSDYATEAPDPNQPLVQIGHHDEYGHWVGTVGDYVRTDTFDANPQYLDEHVSNTPGLPGSGGSPVFDLEGRLVGTTTVAQPRDPRGQEAPTPHDAYVYDWQMSHREWFHHVVADQTYAELEAHL